MTIELLPTAKPLGTTQASGVFTIHDGIAIPGGWGPNAYEPAALPTPFARAEALRLVLARHLTTPGDLPPVHAALLGCFDTMLLGVTSGALTFESNDLRDDKRFDNLGRALYAVDPEARFFGVLRTREPGHARSFGITHHAALFSPHARRTKAEWDNLANAIGPRRGPTLVLIAEWRAALAGAGRWDPALAGCEWQHGVDRLLASENIAPLNNELVHLRNDCQFIGPFWLGLPTGHPEEPVRREPVYVPRYEPGFAARFARLCELPPTTDAARGQIVFQSHGRVAGSIAMPSGGTENNLVMLALGAGGVVLDAAPETAPGEDWINDKPERPGLRTLLRSLVDALQARNPGRVVDAAHVARCPPLYPDPIRVLVGLNRWPAAGQTRMTRRLRAALAGRTVPDATVILEAGGQIVESGDGKTRGTLYLVDALPGLPPVNDLRAIGYGFWQVFTGEVKVVGDRLAPIEALAGHGTPLGGNAEAPLEASGWVYDLVGGEPPIELRRRLATLQRFVKACSDPATPLLAAAATSFARWATGRTEVVPLGRDVRARASWRLPGGEVLALPLDPVEH